MKGQIIPFVFMVLLVAGVMIGYVFYNTFYGTKYITQVFHIRIIDTVRNLIEGFKDYLKLALTYSSHQSLREHACTSGIIGAVEWICNKPNMVEVQQSKECLEKYTKYYLNVYTNFFNTSLPVQISKVNSTKIIHGVDKEGVFSGKYDEGNFWVNSSGSKITILGTNINEYENVDMFDYITKDRYWYLFRNFYKWAEEDVYTPCICSKITCACDTSGLGEEVCGTTCAGEAEDCAQQALDNLQNRFDEYVKCEKIKGCCAQGVGPLCGSPCGCQAWENQICISPCQHECKEPPPIGDICPVGVMRYIRNPYSGEYLTSTASCSEICTSQGYGGGTCRPAGPGVPTGCNSGETGIGTEGCDYSYACCCSGTQTPSKCCCYNELGQSLCTTSCQYDCSSSPCTDVSQCGGKPKCCCYGPGGGGYCTNTCYYDCSSSPCSTDDQCFATTTTTTTITSTTTTTIQSTAGPCHYEARLAAGYTFRCTDYKYNVPSDKGPVPLVFNAGAIAFLRDPCACCTECDPECGC